eukprot:TRINITY_DN10545_c0_g3_i1.p1 TRINITY_DN10545_c0_g3~~TRINITY_DN10545_c0_g3_i1.p1  ORF type:complete len:280 (+),score=70.80 TRINITY_DN10545_c0_g3_i1:47-886(+)
MAHNTEEPVVIEVHEEVEVPTAPTEHAEDDGCAICLCPLEEGVCTITPCNHKFHADCMFEFFEKCGVKSCIMCRGEVETLVKDDGTVVPHEELRKLFKVECYGVRFRSTPFPIPRQEEEASADAPYGSEIMSFFVAPSQVKTVGYSSRRGGYRKITIPPVVLELVDSDGNLSTNHGDVTCSVLHSSATGTISPDTVVFSNGVAYFDQLECKYKPEETRPNIVALQFVVQTPEDKVQKARIYAGVRTVQESEFTMRLIITLAILLVLVVVVSITAIVVPM